MRSRHSLLVVLLVLSTGCLGSTGPVETPTPTTAADGLAVPPMPGYPDRVTAASVAAYANASESHRSYRTAVADGATASSVACTATTLGFAGDAGYALVDCAGTVTTGGVVESVSTTTAYRVNTSGDARIEQVSTLDDGGETALRLRLYNFDATSRSLGVTVTPAGERTNGSATYQYRLDPAAGATTTGLRVADADAYDVAIVEDTVATFSTRWAVTADGGPETPVGVVVLAPEGDLVWGSAPA
ncbi:hypothetical protein [Halomarina rubra]|uniref:Lipoprotein n=1 Tax=Halomarina rubra TaxID=2071873 RepID=A0ABD6ASF4_9EURY|nr:hypothetical protein [Halomarina rubra]